VLSGAVRCCAVLHGAVRCCAVLSVPCGAGGRPPNVKRKTIWVFSGVMYIIFIVSIVFIMHIITNTFSMFIM